MRIFFITSVVTITVPAASSAHVGHLAGLTGHDHLLAGAAIGTAIAIGVLSAIKSRGKQAQQEETEEGAPPESDKLEPSA